MGNFEHFNRVRRANHADRWTAVKGPLLAECPLLAAMKARGESAETIAALEEDHSTGRVHYFFESDPTDIGCAKAEKFDRFKTSGIEKTEAQRAADGRHGGKRVA